MKILILIPTLGYGGAERLLVTLLPKLKDKGIHMKVCTFSAPLDLAPELEKEGIQVINLELKHRWSIFEALIKLYKEIKQFNPDILWGHLYFGILYSRLVSIFFSQLTVVSVLHDSIIGDYNATGLWYKFRNTIYKKTKFLDMETVAVSNSVKNEYEKLFKWKNIKLIYNAIDLNKIDSSIQNFKDNQFLKDKFNIKNEDLFIVVPGRLDKRKGHKYVIEAINKLSSVRKKNIKVLFAGDGPMRDELLTCARNNDVDSQIILPGNLNQELLFQTMKTSNLIVIPSLMEPFGIVAIEAMYLEKPLIVTDIDGLKEITTNNIDAIQVPVKNSKAIADAVMKLIENQDYAKELAKNAKQTVLQYDVNIIVEEWIKIFKSEKK